MCCYISLNITLQVSFSFHLLFLSFFGAFCHALPCAFWHTKPVRSSMASQWVPSDVRPCTHSESQMCDNLLYRVIPTHSSTSPGMFLHKITYSLIWVTPFGAAHTRYHHLLFIVMKWRTRFSWKIMIFSDDSHDRRTFQAYKFVVQLLKLLIPCPRTGYWCYSETPTPGLIVQSFLFLTFKN